MAHKSKRITDTAAPAGLAKRQTAAATALGGASRLVIDAVVGITNIVEDMHRSISSVAPVVGKMPPGHIGGISGLVYRSVRGVTKAVGLGLDAALGQLVPLLGSSGAMPHREAGLAALNGVFGDYLAATNNPLAISMQLRQQGRPLVLERAARAKQFTPLSSNGKLLVLVHGLCMNDLQWHRNGHDHGVSLTQDLGYTSLYLHYNSGRSIAANGHDMALILEQLVQAWPVPVSELTIIGHSMGGLVSRSACYFAEQDSLAWLPYLKNLIFLGTPHHGAPLERAGSWLDLLLGISPYTAPFARLGMVRSSGIKDLRHGNIVGEAAGQGAGKQVSAAAPLPKGVRCFAIAATRQALAGSGKRLPGDGLVPVNSALGLHKTAERTLPIPLPRQHISYGLDHFELLSSNDVYQQIHLWLAQVEA